LEAASESFAFSQAAGNSGGLLLGPSTHSAFQMFNAGFDLLGSAPVLQPLADLAMHVLEQPKKRANSGFLLFLRSCSYGQVVLHAKRSNAVLHIPLALRWAATGRVSIAIPRRQRR
jgi:hypothetical protein